MGEDKYGWTTTPTREVNVPEALAILTAAAMPTQDMAKAVNISYSSLSKLPKRKYGELKELLLTYCVNEVDSKPKWGKV